MLVKCAPSVVSVIVVTAGLAEHGAFAIVTAIAAIGTHRGQAVGTFGVIRKRTSSIEGLLRDFGGAYGGL